MSSGAVWRVGQGIGVAATALLLTGLVWAPETALRILWKVVIPLVPASLLLSPSLWRNVCPLATLNMLGNGVAGRRVQSGRLAGAAVAAGIGLLVLLVPARRFLFNTDGPLLAATILGIAILAVALGAFFDAKAGFCSGLCPVLPVERLYGQSPLIRVRSARCAPCTGCARACIDLSARNSLRPASMAARRGAAWLRTPFGAFAAAFPGFVLAYFTAHDVVPGEAGEIYVRTLLFSAASWLVVAATVRALRLSCRRSLPALGAIAAGLYYWFAAPDLATALGAGSVGGQVRALAIAFVLLWWYRAGSRVETVARAMRRASASPGP